ncbi:hypothetical protein KY290_010566 [Solanum tuberosum]|uniref:Integrase core domain containing protein n=1 Tax=Solanum tuberosum TaxID=4113 RepID=A0ABQ7W0B3_SOLTU|nr:hypothetical protein KY290_010566 [Solanum tuberosum]
MARTRATLISGKGEKIPEIVVEAPAKGRNRARARGRAYGTTLARGRARGATPVRDRSREVSPEPQIDDIEDQVPPEPASTPFLHDTLLRVLNVLKSISQVGCATDAPQDSQTRVRALTQEHQQAPVIQDPVGQPLVDPVLENDLAPTVGIKLHRLLL